MAEKPTASMTVPDLQRIASAAVLDDGDLRRISLRAICWQTITGSLSKLAYESCGRVLAHAISETSAESVVVDCYGVQGMMDHALDAVHETIHGGLEKSVCFLRCEKSFFRAFDNEDSDERLGGRRVRGYRVKPHAESNGNHIAMIYPPPKGELTDHEFDVLVRRSADLALRSIHDALRATYTPFSNGKVRLRSTPVIVPGVFDAAQMISTPRTYMAVTEHLSERLGERLREDIEKPQGGASGREVRLLAMSRPGAALAVGIDHLTPGLDGVDVVDRRRFQQDVIDEHIQDESDSVHRAYIFVSDFALGGTELKLGEAFARYRGALMPYALFIGTALRPEDYSPTIEVLSLASLTEVDPRFNMSIS